MDGDADALVRPGCRDDERGDRAGQAGRRRFLKGFKVSEAQPRIRSCALRALGTSPDANARMGSRWPVRLALDLLLDGAGTGPELPIYPSAS